LVLDQVTFVRCAYKARDVVCIILLELYAIQYCDVTSIHRSQPHAIRLACRFFGFAIFKCESGRAGHRMCLPYFGLNTMVGCSAKLKAQELPPLGSQHAQSQCRERSSLKNKCSICSPDSGVLQPRSSLSILRCISLDSEIGGLVNQDSRCMVVGAALVTTIP
jgi:hypothetical protein